MFFLAYWVLLPPSAVGNTSACAGDECYSSERTVLLQRQGWTGNLADSFYEPDRAFVLNAPYRSDKPDVTEESVSSSIALGQKLLTESRRCLSARMALSLEAGDHQRLQWLDLIWKAEVYILARAQGLDSAILPFVDPSFSDDAQTAIASIVAGRNAAAAIVEQEIEADVDVGLANVLDQGAQQQFLEHVNTVVAACGQDSPDSQALKQQVAESFTPAANWTEQESETVADTLLGIESLCWQGSLDVNYFVTKEGPNNSQHDCNSQFHAVLHQQRNQHAALTEYYAKVALALHDGDNQLGIHFASQINRARSKEEIHHTHVLDKIHAAARSPDLSPAALARLHYIDKKHLQSAFGISKEDDCKAYAQFQESKPEHWRSKHPELQKYHSCVCVEFLPTVVCQAAHQAGLAQVRAETEARLSKALKRSRHAGHPSSLAQATANLTSAWLRPCDVPVSCELCIKDEAVCISSDVSVTKVANGKKKKKMSNSVEGDIRGLFDSIDICPVTGKCSFCAQLVAAPMFDFKLNVGANADQCGTVAQFMASFNIFVNTEVCFSGEVGEVLGELGVDCREYGEIKFYPFLNKLGFAYNWHPPNSGDSYLIRIEVELPLTERLADGAYAYCGSKNRFEHYKCLKALYDAQGTFKVHLKVKHRWFKHWRYVWTVFDPPGNIAKAEWTIPGPSRNSAKLAERDTGSDRLWDSLPRIQHRHGICLDASQRNTEGGKVHMYDCMTSNYNQDWSYDGGSGEIKNQHGMCLDARDRRKRGIEVAMWKCQGNDNQRWTYNSHTGQIKIWDGICLDSPQKSENHGRVHMWDCHNGENQKWKISSAAFHRRRR